MKGCYLRFTIKKGISIFEEGVSPAEMKGIIFDKDGTLFDTAAIYEKSWVKAGKIMGYPITYEICHEISGTSKATQYTILKNHFPDIDPVKTLELCLRFTKETLKEQLPEKPGMHEILEYLAGTGIRMAVASSSPRDQIIEHLTRAGISKYFDYITSGMELTHGKPWPDIFLKAAEGLQLDPSECYVVEDSFNGIRAGYAAGCKTIMIPDQETPTEEIRGLCTACCDDFFEVISLMKEGKL